MRTQRRRIRIRPSRQNNIADKLLAPRPIRPRNNRRLRHAVMPHQRCLDLPRLNPEAAHLNLMVRAPHKLQNPIPTPARQVPAAVHPASRSPIPIRNKALTRQPAATNISPPNPSPRYFFFNDTATTEIYTLSLRRPTRQGAALAPCPRQDSSD